MVNVWLLFVLIFGLSFGIWLMIVCVVLNWLNGVSVCRFFIMLWMIVCWLICNLGMLFSDCLRCCWYWDNCCFWVIVVICWCNLFKVVFLFVRLFSRVKIWKILCLIWLVGLFIGVVLDIMICLIIICVLIVMKFFFIWLVIC